MRRIAVLVAACLLLLSLVPGVAAQGGPELNVQCVSIAGSPAGDAWDEFSLQDAVAAGSAELTVVAPGDDCAIPEEGTACVTVAGSAPDSGWSPGTLTGAIAAGRAQIVLLAAADACAEVVAETRSTISTNELRGVRVLDSAVVAGDFSTSFVATVVNPNENGWAVQGLPLSVSVRNKDREEIEVASAFVSLLPGQTSAVIGFVTTANGAHHVKLTPQGADFNWVPTELRPDVLEISGVVRVNDPVMGFATVGKVRNPGEEPLGGVSIIAVHRGKKGRIIGAESKLIESIPAGRTVSFELPNVSGIGQKQVAETEIYYQLRSVL